ncbi:MAG: choice-of-anchor Q domain-containing protein [Rudaea sp.]
MYRGLSALKISDGLRLAMLLIAGGLGLLPSNAGAVVTAGTITVNDAGDGTGSGVCTLRDAFNLIDGDTPTGNCTASGSQSPPEIHFALSTPVTIMLASALPSTVSVKVVGPGTDQLTISGGNAVRIFNGLTTSNATLNLSNLTLAHGLAPSGSAGGAIFNCCGHAVMLDHVDLHDNRSDYAGGAIDASYDLHVTSSTFENNQAIKASGGSFLSFGGGLYAQSGAISLDHVTMTGNTAGSTAAGSDPGLGGALAVNNGVTIHITDSTFAGNHALANAQRTNFNPNPAGLGGQGGGIFAEGTLDLQRSTVSGNDATFQGGGIYNIAGADVINSTVANNSVSGASSPSQGGGIFNAATNGFGNGVVLKVYDSTVYGNGAGSGGGLYNEHTTAAEVLLNNSAFGNSGTGQAGGDIVNGSGAVLDGTSTLVEDAAHAGGLIDGSQGNIVGQSAQFVGLGNYGGPTHTVRFAPASPLRDSGTNALAVDGAGNPLTSDQRDYAPEVPRIYNGVVDIGAFEFANDLIFADGFGG